MTRDRLICVLVSDGPWRAGFIADGDPEVLEAPTHDAATATEKAQAVAALANDRAAPAGPAVLALPTAWCLAARVDGSAIGRRRRRESLLYRLEESLPLDAEDLTADFVESEGGALGVAVRTAGVAEVLDALEDAGVAIAAICPAAMLALDEATQCDGAAEADACLLAGPSGIDLVAVRDGAPIDWKVAPRPEQTGHGLGASLPLQLRTLARDRDAALRLLACGDAVPSDLERGVDHPVTVSRGTEKSIETLATASAGRVIGSDSRPTLDLRRRDLGERNRLGRLRGPLRAAAAAAALLLIAIVATGPWRAARYDEAADSMRREQETAFRQTFPDQEVPIALLARVRSEQRRLAGLSGSTERIPRRRSLIGLLNDALHAVPKDVRFRVLELRLDAERVYLDGQARSHGDADRVAAAMREIEGYTIEPPRTENLAGRGVAFTIAGAPAAPADAAASGGTAR